MLGANFGLLLDSCYFYGVFVAREFSLIGMAVCVDEWEWGGHDGGMLGRVKLC